MKLIMTLTLVVLFSGCGVLQRSLPPSQAQTESLDGVTGRINYTYPQTLREYRYTQPTGRTLVQDTR